MRGALLSLQVDSIQIMVVGRAWLEPMRAISEDTMNDRELLELAAKAAGIEIVPCTCHYEQWPFKYAEGQGKRGHWNPLTNDGDALRLAVKLDLHVQCDFTEEESKVYVYGGWIGNGIEEELGELDKYAATRRAITRAAAEIGRSMP